MMIIQRENTEKIHFIPCEIRIYTLKMCSLLKIENNSIELICLNTEKTREMISERKRTFSHLNLFSSAQVGAFTCI